MAEAQANNSSMKALSEAINNYAKAIQDLTDKVSQASLQTFDALNENARVDIRTKKRIEGSFANEREVGRLNSNTNIDNSAYNRIQQGFNDIANAVNGMSSLDASSLRALGHSVASVQGDIQGKLLRLYKDNINSFSSIITNTGGYLNATFKIIESVLSGYYTNALDIAHTYFVTPHLFNDALNEWNKLNKQISSTAKDIGLTNSQMVGVQNTIIKNSETMYRWFNISPEEATKTIQQASEATGKLRNYTIQQRGNGEANGDLAYLAYLSKYNATDLLGSFDDLAGSTSVATANFTKMQTNTAAMGLNLKQAKEALKANLAMTQRITFREGISGLEKMILQTQQLKMDMKDVETLAGKFDNIEGAIQASAQLNALGGNIAAQFSNPLDNMYGALYDAESLMDRLNSSLQGMSKFDWKQGVSTVSVFGKQQIKALSQATGISVDDLTKNANQQAKEQAMLSQIPTSVSKMLTQAQRDMLANRAEYNASTGRFEVTTADGKVKDVSSIKSAEDLKNIVSNDPDDAQIDIRDNVRDIAHFLLGNVRGRSIAIMSDADKMNALKGTLVIPQLNRVNKVMSNGVSNMLSYVTKSGDDDSVKRFGTLGYLFGNSESVGKELSSQIEKYMSVVFSHINGFNSNSNSDFVTRLVSGIGGSLFSNAMNNSVSFFANKMVKDGFYNIISNAGVSSNDVPDTKFNTFYRGAEEDKTYRGHTNKGNGGGTYFTPIAVGKDEVTGYQGYTFPQYARYQYIPQQFDGSNIKMPVSTTPSRDKNQVGGVVIKTEAQNAVHSAMEELNGINEKKEKSTATGNHSPYSGNERGFGNGTQSFEVRKNKPLPQQASGNSITKNYTINGNKLKSTGGALDVYVTNECINICEMDTVFNWFSKCYNSLRNMEELVTGKEPKGVSVVMNNIQTVTINADSVSINGKNTNTAGRGETLKLEPISIKIEGSIDLKNTNGEVVANINQETMELIGQKILSDPLFLKHLQESIKSEVEGHI